MRVKTGSPFCMQVGLSLLEQSPFKVCKPERNKQMIREDSWSLE